MLITEIQLAKQYIQKHGIESSQLEVLLLAKGLYASGNLIEALFWIKQTNADPINRIPLEEKIKRKLGLFDGQ